MEGRKRVSGGKKAMREQRTEKKTKKTKSRFLSESAICPRPRFFSQPYAVGHHIFSPPLHHLVSLEFFRTCLSLIDCLFIFRLGWHNLPPALRSFAVKKGRK